MKNAKIRTKSAEEATRALKNMWELARTQKLEIAKPSVGEQLIREAIAALKIAIKAGDKAEEAMANWRTTAVQIEKCLTELTAKPAAKLAVETWG
jgi:hypothetical protein